MQMPGMPCVLWVSIIEIVMNKKVRRNPWIVKERSNADFSFTHS